MSGFVILWGVLVGFGFGNFISCCVGYAVRATTVGLNEKDTLRSQAMVVLSGLALGFAVGMALWSMTR